MASLKRSREESDPTSSRYMLRSNGSLPEFHISNLRNQPLYEETQHVTLQPRKKPKYEDKIYWVSQDGKEREITNIEMQTFVDSGTAPANVIKININYEYYAETKSYEQHLFSNSCILKGQFFKMDKHCEIKISKNTCLGMRELKAAEKVTPGCAKIYQLYSKGEYNIFVREYSGTNLADMIAKEDEIDVYKIVTELAKILKYLHGKKKLVRFIVPENIWISTENGEQKIQFEEFNTLKYMNKDDSDYESSGNECEKISFNNFGIQAKNSQEAKSLSSYEKETYTAQSEISLFGQLIENLEKGTPGVINLAKRIQHNRLSLEQIELHPILQSTEGYFTYIANLLSWLKTGGNYLHAKKLATEFDLFFGKEKFQISVFCNRIFSYLHKIYKDDKNLKEKDDNEKGKIDNDLKYLDGYLRALSLAYRESYSIFKVRTLKVKQFDTHVEFQDHLRLKSMNIIEMIHFTVIQMWKTSYSDIKDYADSLRLPSHQNRSET